MASITKKIKKGRPYYYAVESKRINGRLRIVWQKYLGTLEAIVNRVKDAKPPKPKHTIIFEAGGIAALLRITQRLTVLSLLTNLSEGPFQSFYSPSEYPQLSWDRISSGVKQFIKTFIENLSQAEITNVLGAVCYKRSKKLHQSWSNLNRSFTCYDQLIILVFDKNCTIYSFFAPLVVDIDNLPSYNDLCIWRNG